MYRYGDGFFAALGTDARRALVAAKERSLGALSRKVDTGDLLLALLSAAEHASDRLDILDGVSRLSRVEALVERVPGSRGEFSDELSSVLEHVGEEARQLVITVTNGALLHAIAKLQPPVAAHMLKLAGVRFDFVERIAAGYENSERRMPEYGAESLDSAAHWEVTIGSEGPADGPRWHGADDGEV